MIQRGGPNGTRSNLQNSSTRLHCIAPARDLLAPLYARFTEGFATADLEAAKALLESARIA